MDAEKLKDEFYKKFTQIIRNPKTGDPVMLLKERTNPFDILDWIEENFMSKYNLKSEQSENVTRVEVIDETERAYKYKLGDKVYFIMNYSRPSSGKIVSIIIKERGIEYEIDESSGSYREESIYQSFDEMIAYLKEKI